ncbi:MAG: ABC-2 type transport system permease protein [Candidatus Aldehydirespiratoraceae bacterium]|jgi:ABC-2 type transport system permease protein
MTASGESQILDRGYRRFEGQRSGVGGAVRSLSWHTTRGVLGLGRKARYKIAPTIIIVIAFLPALVFIGFAIIFGSELFGEFDVIPEYSELAGQSVAAIVLFVTLVAPDALVRDRRDGMLSLYLSTPLTRLTYLISKIFTVTGVLAIIVLVPTLIYFLGLTFASFGPDGFGDWILTLGRIVISGVLASLVFALISMACSSLTDRRAFASVAVFLVMFGLLTVVGVMIEVGDASTNWRLMDPLNMPFELIARIFGSRGEYPEISTINIYLANGGWAGGSLGLIWWRLRGAS